MKIPYRWIREFVDLQITPEQAADRLINAGVEVASVTSIAPDVKGVVVGQIEAIERELGESHGHRLALCRVSTGAQRFSVVCGAPNAGPGMRAAFAPPGAVLPGNRAIGTTAIRDVTSEGMLCSERELGLGDEHEAGIFALAADAPLGADLVRYLGLDDVVLEIEITPNRPDCLSVVGIARELSALTGAPFHAPKIALTESNDTVDALARVRIEDPDLCHRFTARVISDVKIGPSPAWMAARLRAVGLRPISNVVDVTNYVMWEIGHPLHAFDGATVTDATIVVRRARPNERLKTLDGQDRALDPSMLLIADPRRGLGIAGVMGGAESEVTAATTRVLLESAYFLPASIRRTSRTLGLKTDAAYRFERGADIEALVDGSARAAHLIRETAGGRIARGMIDAYPTPHATPRVRLRMSRVRRLLGVAPDAATAASILSGLGLSTERRGDELDVTIPSFRRDLTMEDDLVEEVVRVWGYDRIPSTLPGGAIHLVRLPATRRQERRVREALVGAGLVEAVTFSFNDQARAALLRGPEDTPPIELLNPLTEDAAILRHHPLAGLLGVVATNIRRRQPTVHVFEIAPVFVWNWAAPGVPQAPHTSDAPQVPQSTREPRWASIALTGARGEPTWYRGDERVDVYDAKGLAEHVIAALGVRARGAPGGALAGFEPDCHGVLVADGGAAVGEFGEVAAAVREGYGIDSAVFAAVLDLDALAALPPAPVRHEPLPRFPAVQRDMAFVVGADQQIAAADVEAALRAEAGPLLSDVTLFDVFRFNDGRRSLAWRLTFQAPERTLTDDEVNAIHARVARAITERFSLTLRTA